MRLGCLILHLEDDDNDAFLFERVLVSLNFTGVYRRVSTFDEATQYLAKSLTPAESALYPVPDIFVTDGTATLPRLVSWLNQRAELRDLVRIILTGGMRAADQEKLMSLGFKYVLPKGSTLEELTLSVQKILE